MLNPNEPAFPALYGQTNGAATFAIPNPLQQHTRYTVTGPAQQVNADAMIRSGCWVIVERKESQ